MGPDLTNKRWILAKGVLFLILAIFSGVLQHLEGLPNPANLFGMHESQLIQTCPEPGNLGIEGISRTHPTILSRFHRIPHIDNSTWGIDAADVPKPTKIGFGFPGCLLFIP